MIDLVFDGNEQPRVLTQEVLSKYPPGEGQPQLTEPDRLRIMLDDGVARLSFPFHRSITRREWVDTINRVFERYGRRPDVLVWLEEQQR